MDVHPELENALLLIVSTDDGIFKVVRLVHPLKSSNSVTQDGIYASVKDGHSLNI